MVDILIVCLVVCVVCSSTSYYDLIIRCIYYLLYICCSFFVFFFSSRRRHTRCGRDWSSDVCSSDLPLMLGGQLDAVRERVVRRDAVGVAGVDVEAQDAAEQRRHVLAVAQRRVALGDVVRGAPVAEPQVQEAVVAEQELAAVVVHLRLVDLEEHALGGGVEPAVVAQRELGEDRRVVPARGPALTQRRAVVGEGAAVLREVGVEREAEEATLVVPRVELDDPVGDVEERDRKSTR